MFSKSRIPLVTPDALGYIRERVVPSFANGLSRHLQRGRDLVVLRAAAKHRERLMVQPDLDYLFWEATLRCNLRCRHCGSSCEATSPVKELSTSQILGIFDTVAEDFDSARVFVTITGGEPLLRHDLTEVVRHLTRLGFRSSMVTNGTLLTKERAAELVQAGMDTVSVSIDGLQDTHEHVRGKGTFRGAMRGLENAKAAGFAVREAITAVRPSNLHQLPEIERAVRSAGANLWRCITVDEMGRLAQAADNEFWLEPPEVRQLFDFVQRRRRELKEEGRFVDVTYSCGGFTGLDRERGIRDTNIMCAAGLTIGSILCDGQVSACPSLPRSWAQGSALETRFSKIWFERFEQFRSHEVRRQGPCADCSWYPVCLGGGLHERLAQPDKFCWLDRQGI